MSAETSQRKAVLNTGEILALEEVPEQVLWCEDDEPRGYLIAGQMWNVGWLGDKRVRCKGRIPAFWR